MGGDYNCTLNPRLDRNTPEPHLPSARYLAKLVQKFKFWDVWRLQNPNTRQYTWVCCSKKQITMGRLDRLYVNQGMVNLVQRTSISPSGFSDHHMIIMECMLPFHCCNSAYWTFNVKLLQDVQFENAFRLVWKKLEKQKCSYPNTRQWWDCTKSQIRIFCQQYCSHATSNASGLISALKADVLKYEQEAGTSRGSDHYQQLVEKRPYWLN